MRSGVSLRPRAQVFASSITLLAGLFSLSACGHMADNAADRQFAEMRDQVGKIQSEQDRDGRLAFEGDDADLKLVETPPLKAVSTPAIPAPAAPRTVQIGSDGDDGQSDDPNDPSTRPEIRLQGQAGSAPRPLRGKTTHGKNGDVRIEPSDATRDDTRSDSSHPSVLDPDAKRSYDDALSLVNAKQYDRALEALGTFLTKWPDHPYVENALYWRGEVYYARGEYLRAAEQFEAVLARGGSKAPDALLKIGRCHERLGSADRAKEYWDRLRRDYPRSDAAKKLSPLSDDSHDSHDSRGSRAPKSDGTKESR